MRIRSAALALLGALLMSGCGRSDLQGSGESDMLSPAVVERKIASAHLDRQLTQPPRTLDPAYTEDIPGLIVLSDLFEGLVRTDPEGNIVPGVAESWEVSPDGTLYRFNLRSNAAWSDGSPLTAEDFVFGMRRIVTPATASPAAPMLLSITGADDVNKGLQKPETLGVTAVDARTLEIRLDAPTPYFLSLLTNPYMLPQPAGPIGKYGRGWTAPGRFVGNGAFLPKQDAGGGPLELVRNPRYWDAAAVRLQSVTYHPLPDSSAATSRFLAGDFDITDSFLVDDYRWLKQRLGSQVRLADYLGTFMMGLNTSRPPFNDVRLRRALVLAVDRDVMTGQLMRGLYKPAVGIVPPIPGYPAVRPAWADLPREARLAEARRLYAEAGYSESHPLEVELSYPTTTPDTRRLFEAMAAMWRINLGAHMQLANEDWRVFNQNKDIGKHRLFFAAWIGDYPDPQTFLALPLPGSLQNDMKYSNPRYTQVVKAALQSTDAGERAALYNEAERILDQDAPYVPIYYYQSRHLLRPYVRGWADNAVDQHLSRDLYLGEPESSQ